MQSVYAGPVGDQRTQVLLLGLAIAATGVAVYCSAWRLLLVVSAAAALASFLIARGTIDDVSAIAADEFELVSEVGWALYRIQVAALVVVTAVVGLWGLARRRRADAGVSPLVDLVGPPRAEKRHNGVAGEVPLTIRSCLLHPRCTASGVVAAAVRVQSRKGRR